MSQLGQHLLTRSDLARLSIPAARILSWLASGSMEQIGSVPNGRTGGDPVFTVLTRDLRQELAQRLAEIGKASAVFTPLRVRSLLLRTMLAERLEATADDEGARGAAEIADLVTHLEQSDLGSVLREALQEVAAEATAIERIAAEEAAREAAELGEPAAQSPTDLAADADDERALRGDAEAAADLDEADAVGFYDPADLLQELQSWGADPADASAQPTATTVPAASEQDESLGPTAAELDALRDALAASLADYRNVDKPFGPDAPSLEATESAPPPAAEDPFERLSATLEQVRALVHEAASLDVWAELGPTKVPEPSHATLASLTALDEPMQDQPSMPSPGEADAEVDMDDASANAALQPEAPDSPQLIELEPIDDGLPVDDRFETLAPAATGAPVPGPGGGEEPTTHGESPVADALDIGAAGDEDSASTAAQDGQPRDSATVGEALDAMFGLRAPTDGVSTPARPPATEPVGAGLVLAEVRTFLGELRESLVGLSKGPVAASADLGPLVETVRTGFERSQRELAQTNVAIGSLVECVARAGSRIEHRIAGTPRNDDVSRAADTAVASGNVARGGASLVLLGASLLIACWSLVLWWKTGNARLAIGTMLGANAVACCLLLGRR